MRRYFLRSACCVLALLAVGCANSSDNNQPLEYETLSVNFEGSLTAASWTKGAAIGVFSSCTRNDVSDVQMSVNANAQFTVWADGPKSDLIKASDNDDIVARSTDHNFMFYAYYPYSASITDMHSMAVNVASTQSYAAGIMNYACYVAQKSVTSVVAPVELEFKSVFSTLELYIPRDVIDADGRSVIRSLSIKPVVEANFDGALALSGVYNLETGRLTADEGTLSKEITVDFGEQGIALTENFTKVAVAVAPFTSPLGGFDVVFTDMKGDCSSSKFLTRDTDAGTVVAAGDVITAYLSASDDGFVPVSFPVVFPLGYEGDAYLFSATTQPLWKTDGVWTCPTQEVATITWNKVSDPSATIAQTLEYVNSTKAIGSPGIKGIWTGDYFEISLPVKQFAAGTTVNVQFPMYTRQGPVFWYIEYLDGDEWKCNKSSITCYDPAYSMEATFALVRGGKVIEHNMTFEKAISKGLLKIRITCADGTIQASDADKITVRDTPYASSGKYGAPFYLYMAESDVKAVTISM